jgi:hypothetical protein
MFTVTDWPTTQTKKKLTFLFDIWHFVSPTAQDGAQVFSGSSSDCDTHDTSSHPSAQTCQVGVHKLFCCRYKVQPGLTAHQLPVAMASSVAAELRLFTLACLVWHGPALDASHINTCVLT